MGEALALVGAVPFGKVMLVTVGGAALAAGAGTLTITRLLGAGAALADAGAALAELTGFGALRDHQPPFSC